MPSAKLLEVGVSGRQHIDRYELVAEIASGGMATVFLGRLSGVGGFQRFVAIKRLHPHLAQEEEFVEMFLDEARLAAGIHHPNVVPILEVGTGNQGYYLVMDYVEGDTLARLLARAATAGTRLPPGIGVRIILDALRGLHAAHELHDDQGNPAELVHRDVSPQNLIVGVDGTARVIDFGVARAASRLSATRAGQLKGKLAYMAPEQAMGKAIDRRSDIFSIGVVLWEVLAARRLFKADNEAATLTRVVSAPVPALQSILAELDEGICDICAKALNRDPDKRFPTCAVFADALEQSAVSAGVLTTHRDVAAYVQEVLGNEIAQQREAVRTWLSRSEVSGSVLPASISNTLPPSASSVSAAAMSFATGEVSATNRSSLSVPASTIGAATGSRRKAWGAFGLAAAGLAVYWFGFRAEPQTPNNFPALQSVDPSATLAVPNRPTTVTMEPPKSEALPLAPENAEGSAVDAGGSREKAGVPLNDAVPSEQNPRRLQVAPRRPPVPAPRPAPATKPASPPVGPVESAAPAKETEVKSNPEGPINSDLSQNPYR